MTASGEFRPYDRQTAKEDIRQGQQFAIDRALTLLGATLGTDAEGDPDELVAALAYCEEVFIQLHNPKAASGIVAVPVNPSDPDTAYMPMYTFDDDPSEEYLHSNYDPAHDPFAGMRSIQAEYEGSLPSTSTDGLIGFARATGLPLTFLPGSNG